MLQATSRNVRRALVVGAIGLVAVGIVVWRDGAPDVDDTAVTDPRGDVPIAGTSGAATTVVGATQSLTSTSEGTEICGHGRVPIDLSSDDAQIQFNAQLVGPKEGEWIAALQESGDLRTRAAGLILDGRHFGDRLVTSASEQARNDLIQLAIGTSDPAVYGLALNMCRLYDADELVEACRQLSANRWQRLDPDNAAPWLFIAEHAKLKRDEQAVASALVHASEAHSVRYYNDALSEFVAPAVPAGLPEYDKYLIQRDVASYSDGLSQPPYQLLLQYCSGAALQDPIQLRACTSIANLLIEHGRDVMDFAVGMKIGQHVGWSSGRLAALREELTAMIGGLRAAAGPDPGSCASIQRLNQVLGGQVEAGKIGAARAAIRASGQSIREPAKGNRSVVDLMMDGLDQQTATTDSRRSQ